jgi:hypothetical protein
MKFKEIFSKIPYVLIGKGLSSEEWELLNYSVKTLGAEVVYWDSSRPEPYLHPGQILLTSEFSQNSLKMGSEWALPLTVLGRLNPEEKDLLFKHRVVSYWDLAEVSIFNALSFLGKKAGDTELDILLWTQSQGFFEILQSLFRFYPVRLTYVNQPDAAIINLSTKVYHLMILDWDDAGIEVLQILKEFRILKADKKILPEILGIKDFDKMNVFKDLSSGIREFCGVLFSPGELLELILKSFPILEGNPPFSNMEKEFPVLTLQSPEMGGKVYMDYRKESRVSDLKNRWTKQEIDRLLYRKQFEWILPRLSA